MSKLKHLLVAVSLPALLLVHPAIAAETGSALKNDSMRAEPFTDAKIAGNITRGDSVEIIKKQGAWLQIKTKKSTGWVRILSVKRGGASASNQSAGVLALASGRAGTGQVVSTTGIRGLSEEELKAAKFNEAEVKSMESYTISADQGRKFANKGKLKTVAFSNLSAEKGEAQ